MTILLIEDDEFKAADIARMLEETGDLKDVSRAASVTSALRAITTKDFDLIILDMSLPTFDLSGPGGGGSPQGQGGLEVLRLARRLGRRCPIIVVTQYPDIELEGTEIPLEEAAETLSRKFGLDVRACIPYEFDQDGWRSLFQRNLRDP
jgi:CheY-like chemotaxis protein